MNYMPACWACESRSFSWDLKCDQFSIKMLLSVSDNLTLLFTKVCSGPLSCVYWCIDCICNYVSKTSCWQFYFYTLARFFSYSLICFLICFLFVIWHSVYYSSILCCLSLMVVPSCAAEFMKHIILPLRYLRIVLAAVPLTMLTFRNT